MGKCLDSVTVGGPRHDRSVVSPTTKHSHVFCLFVCLFVHVCNVPAVIIECICL